MTESSVQRESIDVSLCIAFISGMCVSFRARAPFVFLRGALIRFFSIDIHLCIAITCRMRVSATFDASIECPLLVRLVDSLPLVLIDCLSLSFVLLELRWYFNTLVFQQGRRTSSHFYLAPYPTPDIPLAVHIHHLRVISFSISIPPSSTSRTCKERYSEVQLELL